MSTALEEEQSDALSLSLSPNMHTEVYLTAAGTTHTIGGGIVNVVLIVVAVPHKA